VALSNGIPFPSSFDEAMSARRLPSAHLAAIDIAARPTRPGPPTHGGTRGSSRGRGRGSRGRNASPDPRGPDHSPANTRPQAGGSLSPPRIHAGRGAAPDPQSPIPPGRVSDRDIGRRVLVSCALAYPDAADTSRHAVRTLVDAPLLHIIARTSDRARLSFLVEVVNDGPTGAVPRTPSERVPWHQVTLLNVGPGHALPPTADADPPPRGSRGGAQRRLQGGYPSPTPHGPTRIATLDPHSPRLQNPTPPL